MIPVYLDSEITRDSVKELMNILSKIDDEVVTIYITSPGGDWPATQVLMHYIEEVFEEVHLVISGYIASSAWKFALLLRNVQTITVMDGAMGYDHLPTITDSIVLTKISNHKGNYSLNEEVHNQDCEWWTKLCKTEFGYTDAEIELLTSGSEVYFNKDRMDEVIRNSTLFRKS